MAVILTIAIIGPACCVAALLPAAAYSLVLLRFRAAWRIAVAIAVLIAIIVVAATVLSAAGSDPLLRAGLYASRSSVAQRARAESRSYSLRGPY